MVLGSNQPLAPEEELLIRLDGDLLVYYYVDSWHLFLVHVSVVESFAGSARLVNWDRNSIP